MNVIDHLLLIIEHPYVEKVYQDLKKYYETQNMLSEAKAIQHLIERKFKDNGINNLHSSS